MISVTTEAPEKTDTAPVSAEQVEGEVQTNDTAPVSAEQVEEEVQRNNTVPVSKHRHEIMARWRCIVSQFC